MEFKFNFYFSFFFGLVKWNSISISIFRFLSTEFARCVILFFDWLAKIDKTVREELEVFNPRD